MAGLPNGVFSDLESARRAVFLVDDHQTVVVLYRRGLVALEKKTSLGCSSFCKRKYVAQGVSPSMLSTLSLTPCLQEGGSWRNCHKNMHPVSYVGPSFQEASIESELLRDGANEERDSPRLTKREATYCKRPRARERLCVF